MCVVDVSLGFRIVCVVWFESARSKPNPVSFGVNLEVGKGSMRAREEEKEENQTYL